MRFEFEQFSNSSFTQFSSLQKIFIFMKVIQERNASRSQALLLNLFYAPRRIFLATYCKIVFKSFMILLAGVLKLFHIFHTKIILGFS